MKILNKNALFTKALFLSLLTLVSGSLAAQTVNVEGIQISTNPTTDPAESGVYVASATLPVEDVFLIQYLFTGDADTTDLSASFNGTALPILEGDPLVSGALATLALDISAFQAASGTFRLELTSSSDEVQRFVVIDAVSLEGDNQAGEPEAPGEAAPVSSSGGGGGGSTGGLLVFVALFVLITRFIATKVPFKS